MELPQNLTHKDYLRPLKLSILFSVLGEAIIFVIWGILLYPEGNLVHKFLWTVVFCGFGMGAAIGAIITLLVVGKWKGIYAVILCAELSGLVLGLFCNYVCYNLDMHFDYFGGKETPVLFVMSGTLIAILGGALVGWLSFTERGKRFLKKYNI